MAEELDIQISDEARQQMDEDPAAAEAIRIFCASIRQAHHSVETGQHASLFDAMEAITGMRPCKLPDGSAEGQMNVNVTRARRQDPFSTQPKPDFVTRLWLAFAMARSVLRWRR